MPRKSQQIDGRRKRVDLRTVKTQDLQREYWDEMLRREGLSMHKGRSHRLVYAGDAGALEVIQEQRVGGVLADSRRTPPAAQAE